MISILMPIYNGIEFINESVTSIITQSFNEWELIIGINGHAENSEVFKVAKQYENIDSRITADSVIYYKNDKEIVFSNKKELDAIQTAFSAFESYGIKILNITYYYYLPKKKLSKKEVFRHAIYVAEKDKDIREIIFVALFYLKFKEELKSIKNNLLEDIKEILKGKTIKGLPTLNEIKDRAITYDIKL